MGDDITAVQERDRLVAVLAGAPGGDGYSLACVAGLDAEAVVRRLGVRPAEPTAEQLRTWTEEDPFHADAERTIGVTTVPGGCVLLQPWGFGASDSALLDRLSEGTVAYGMYANPKSGNQGSIHRDGEIEAWDLHPGGGPDEDETDDDEPDDELAELYDGEPVAYCCAFAGLRPVDQRAFTTPDLWIRLPS
ncbi:DUF6461 domain-containing protein [Nocardia sp. NRRL S-836]|uniref:DUF6461 domain-containing protein n=1 Tax=Nocardia sp. NRRL S-836 TaxID=1519492 RepID=UPI0006AFFE15|nr:DUF6461 domain-containing protein [Nocardia sp. NRRL S-836]KOV88313.1 hypothetical protein ADL03_05410 [Nocardia sp. NRRL S-836]